MAETALVAGRVDCILRVLRLMVKRLIGDTMTRPATTSATASTGRPSVPGIFSSTRLWTLFTVILVPICLATSTETVPNRIIGPAYRIDLRSVLKANAVPQLSTRETPWVPVITLAFLNDERLVATFVVPAKVAPGLTARDRPDAASPFRLCAVVLDASTGRVLATPEWPSNSRAAGIVAANDRGLVIEIGVGLTLLSPDLTAVEQTTLPSPSATGGHADGMEWGPTAASWSGKRVLLSAGPAWAAHPWLWLDTEKLRVLKSWEDSATGSVTVSDDRLVIEPFSRHFGDPPRNLEVAVPGGDWKPLPSTMDASASGFAGPNLLYFHRYIQGTVPPRTENFLMRIDTGEVSRLEPPRKDWDLGQAAVSRIGNRFVILVGQIKGFHPALDIGGHSVLEGLLIYDVPFRVPSYTLRIRDSKVRNASAALSPDGRHLAVLGHPDPILEVFELPPLN